MSRRSRSAWSTSAIRFPCGGWTTKWTLAVVDSPTRALNSMLSPPSSSLRMAPNFSRTEVL